MYKSLNRRYENPINVFIEKELRDLSPNFHIHVSVSELYIPRIGLSSAPGKYVDRFWEYTYKPLTGTYMWKLGLRPCNSFTGNICFKFFSCCVFAVHLKLCSKKT
jgi:hypothetical protein